MSSDATTLPAGVGAALTVLGGVSQVLLSRRVGLNKKLSWAAAALLLAISLAAGEDLMPDVWRALGLQHFRIWLSALLFLWFLCMLSAAMLLAAIEAVRSLTARPNDYSLPREALPDLQRRRFLTASTAAACALPGAAFAYGIVTRKDFEVNYVDLKFPELPDGLTGLKILQISDIHMGVFYTRKTWSAWLRRGTACVLI